MLLRQKPYDCKHYIVIDDVQLNSLLQLMNFCPKYFYDGKYYYKKDRQLETVVKIYKTTKAKAR